MFYSSSFKTASFAHLKTCERQALNRSARAFSLIEITVVLALVGVLASIVTVNVRQHLITGKQNAVKAEMSAIMTALETFYTMQGRYPTNEEGLQLLASKPATGGEALLKHLPRDPWGREYQYNNPGQTEPFELICFGADGEEGGDGADADISSESMGEASAARP